MRKVLAALALAVITSAPAAHAQQSDVMAVINQFVNGFNTGDTKSAAAACADQTAIVDEFSPHAWEGKGACMKWMDDYVSDAAKQGITDGVVTLGAPKHLDVSGAYAYVVIPSDYAFKQKGALVRETGSLFTFALHQDQGGWRITGWSWAKN